MTGRPSMFSTRWGPGDGSRTGASAAPYESFNLGAGVADNPGAVRDNRNVLAARWELAPDHLIWMSQVHGTRVHRVTAPTSAPVPATDALVTALPGLGLAVLVADCVPVLARDPRAGVIGVAHAGRSGAADGIGQGLVAAMAELGADVTHLEVLLGPAICGRCYEVPSAMRDEVDSRLPGSAAVTATGTAGLDLRAGLSRQLTDMGVRAVEVDGRCTREDPDLFSHRRSARTGRFAGVVRL